ncbi:MAG: ABC transporter permease [Phycisphaerae bacterium]|nr:ABC transporter permease [Phycisphaerae bacterium]
MLNPLFFIQAVGLALAQIWANKVRSMLTALGIIVGVASVTAVIATLMGLKTKVLSEFESFGASKIFIFPDRPDNAPRNAYPWEKIRLTPDEVRAISDGAPSVKAVTPITEVGLSVESDREKLDSVSIVGIWPDWHECEKRGMLSGRPFSRIDDDQARQVCLVNEAAIKELQLPNEPTGEHLLLGGRRFLIVGVVETVTSAMFGRGASQSEIFVPFSVAEKLQDKNFFMRISALIKSPELADEAKSEIRFVLRRSRGLTGSDPDTFQVEAIDQYIEKFKALAASVTAIASGIVGISLLVGGIGIMNIMLVSVSERTREIGLRKAVGATPGAVLMQFLLEAVTLCLAGGFVGVAIGQALAFGLTKIPNAGLDKAEVPLWAVFMSFGFCALVGVVFGMFPAIKAARLDPIEALRHE